MLMRRRRREDDAPRTRRYAWREVARVADVPEPALFCLAVDALLVVFIAGALGAAKSATAAARRPSAAAAPPAVSLDGAIDAWPLADPGAAAAEGAGDALAELHVDTAETVRAIAAAQAKALALALDAGRNAQAAALAGDNQTKFQWLDTLQSLLDAAEQAAAPPPAEAARPDEGEPEDEGDAAPPTYEAPEGAGPDLD